MNQSKQKAADALAKAVREIIDYDDGCTYIYGHSDTKVPSMLADYEAIAEGFAGPEQDALNAADKLALEVEDQLKLLEAGIGVSTLALRWKLNTYDKQRSQHAPTDPALPATGEQPDLNALIKRLQRWHNDNVVDGIPCGDWHIESSPEQAAIILQNWLRESATGEHVTFNVEPGASPATLSALEQVAKLARATGEQPGAEPLSVNEEMLCGLLKWFIGQCQGDSGAGENYWDQFSQYRLAQSAVLHMERAVKHAPAKPALAEVSARELISRVLKIRGEPGAYQAIDSISLRQALDQLETDRAAKP